MAFRIDNGELEKYNGASTDVELPVRHIAFGEQIFGRELTRQGDSTICTLAPIEENTGFPF